MRVGLVATLVSGPASGAERRLLCLAPRLAARGIEVVLFVSDRIERFPLPPGDRITFIPLGIPPRPALARAAAERLLLPRAVRRHRLDLLDIDHYPIPPIRDTPVVATLHDLRHLGGHPRAPLARRLLARRVYATSLARAAAVVAVSAFTARQIEERLGVPRARLTVVPNAADHLESPVRPVAAGDSLLHVGHVEPRKNLEVLIEALPRLDARGIRLRIELAGREGKRGTVRRLRSRAARLGVDDRIRFAGRVPDSDLPRLYGACFAAVFPSKYEGFGIPLLEAMRCGAPVVASNAAAHPETGGDGALYFDPSDPGALASRVERLIREPASREAAREAGRARAAQFSWDRSAERLIEVYRTVAG